MEPGSPPTSLHPSSSKDEGCSGTSTTPKATTKRLWLVFAAVVIVGLTTALAVWLTGDSGTTTRRSDDASQPAETDPISESAPGGASPLAIDPTDPTTAIVRFANFNPDATRCDSTERTVDAYATTGDITIGTDTAIEPALRYSEISAYTPIANADPVTIGFWTTECNGYFRGEPTTLTLGSGYQTFVLTPGDTIGHITEPAPTYDNTATISLINLSTNDNTTNAHIRIGDQCYPAPTQRTTTNGPLEPTPTTLEPGLLQASIHPTDDLTCTRPALTEPTELTIDANSAYLLFIIDTDNNTPTLMLIETGPQRTR